VVKEEAGGGLRMCLTASPQSPVWWGTFGLESCVERAWRIGPLQLWVQSLPMELRVAMVRGVDPQLGLTTAQPDLPSEQPPEDAEVMRFGLKEAPKHVVLSPGLADRPMVARPRVPLLLPPGGRAAIFLSTPLWVRVEADEPQQVLLDVPTYRPSDTWFGPSTVKGELCYASATQAHMDLSLLERLPHRVISSVVIHNRASDLLTLKRIKLPTAQLSLFVDAQGFLWTQSMMLERESATESDLVFMHLSATPPVEAGDTQRVSQPREQDRGRFVRALQAFLS
jgi:hypothetical protein